MGTNYYHHTKVCKCCNRPGEVTHIGKRSGGWAFMFHAPDDVRSRKQWFDRLASGGYIFDEYGELVTLAEFEEIVEDTRGGKNHYDYCMIHHPSHAARGWKDDEGWSFMLGEFS